MNSLLNPEAPEFHPHLTNVVQEGYLCVNKAVKTVNRFPVGPPYKVFQTFTGFNMVTHQISENVVIQSNEITATEIPAVKLKRNKEAQNINQIIDVNDNLLDRVHINIDNINGLNDPDEAFLKASTKLAVWNQTPVIAKVQLGSATLIGAKNILRPQLNFKDPVDNSDNLWVPKISDKPNNIKPLALNIIYNEKGEAVGYEHPYRVELDLYHAPMKMMEPDQEPYPYPASLQDTPFTYVDTDAKLEELVKHLDGVTEIAVDVEHHSYRTYQGITCLIQITTLEGGDFIIDALAIREHIHKLNLSFTDPKKLKVFHGAESDVKWMQRDFGVYIVGMFDTYQAAKELQLSGLSLKYLLMRYCNVDADKKYQLADWRMRPLPDELIEYARIDTHYLIYIWHQMKRELLELGGGHNQPLYTVFENSKFVCLATYNKEKISDESHFPIYIRSKKNFNNQQMGALKLLYKWRDMHAREMDESTTYLIPNHMLFALSETLPRDVQGIHAICSPMPPFVKQNVLNIHRMILTSRELPIDSELFLPPKNPPVVTLKPRKFRGPVNNFPPAADFNEEPTINADLCYTFINEPLTISQPDVEAFQHDPVNYPKNITIFVPPYYRYKIQLLVNQIQEMEDIKRSEKRITLISKGDAFIKAEILNKLQDAKVELQRSINRGLALNEHFTVKPSVAAPIVSAKAAENTDNGNVNEELEGSETNAKKKASQRKRKIQEKLEQKSVEQITEKKKESTKVETNDKKDTIYKNINYKKFYSETGGTSRLHKMKIKKS